MTRSRMIGAVSSVIIMLAALSPAGLRAATEEPEGCLVGGDPYVSGCGITWGVPGSGGSCGVECRDGYMACCNPSSCKCIKIADE